MNQATCDECGRSLTVIPYEFVHGERAPEFSVQVQSRDSETADYNGPFSCPCGAVGFMRGHCVIGPRGPSSPPSAMQRAFLEALADGPRSSTELADRFDFGDPPIAGELTLAYGRGWMSMQLTGIGGLLARPATIFDLSEAGRAALNEADADERT